MFESIAKIDPTALIYCTVAVCGAVVLVAHMLCKVMVAFFHRNRPIVQQVTPGQDANAKEFAELPIPTHAIRWALGDFILAYQKGEHHCSRAFYHARRKTLPLMAGI